MEFALPDCSDVASIGEYALKRLNTIIDAYEAFLNRVRGTDDLSFHLVLDLLAAETHQRADLQAALADQGIRTVALAPGLTDTPVPTVWVCDLAPG